jgi:hypothetical protein
MADLLRKGMSASSESIHAPGSVTIASDPETRLPIILCRQSAAGPEEITPPSAQQTFCSSRK